LGSHDVFLVRMLCSTGTAWLPTSSQQFGFESQRSRREFSGFKCSSSTAETT
jgi:hypothetical protein